MRKETYHRDGHLYSASTEHRQETLHLASLKVIPFFYYKRNKRNEHIKEIYKMNCRKCLRQAKC